MKRFISCILVLVLCFSSFVTVSAKITSIGAVSESTKMYNFDTYPSISHAKYYNLIITDVYGEGNTMDLSTDNYSTDGTQGQSIWLKKYTGSQKFYLGEMFSDMELVLGKSFRVSYMAKADSDTEDRKYNASDNLGVRITYYDETSARQTLCESSSAEMVNVTSNGWSEVSYEFTIKDASKLPSEIEIVASSTMFRFFIDNVKVEQLSKKGNLYDFDKDTSITNVEAKYPDTTMALSASENYSENSAQGQSLWLKLYANCLFWVNGMFNGVNTSVGRTYKVSYMAKIDSDETNFDTAKMGMNIYYDNSGTRAVLKNFAAVASVNKTGWSEVSSTFTITDPTKIPTEISITSDSYIMAYVDDIKVEEVNVTENKRTFNEDAALTDYDAHYDDTIALTDAENASPEGEAGKSVWIKKYNNCNFWFGGLFSGLDLSQGRVFRVSYMAKVDSNAENQNTETKLGMNIYYPNSSGTRTILYTADVDTTVTQNEWTKVTFEFTVTDETKIPTEIGIVASNYVMLYIDDLTATDITTAMRVANIYSDNMVFQRGEEINIWGYGNENGDEISVSILDNEDTVLSSKTATVADKKWSVTLPAMTAQRDLKIKVVGGGEEIEYTNIAIGDVWVLSGQSNIEMQMEDLYGADDYITASDNYDIRFMDVDVSISFEEQAEPLNSTWRLVDSNNVGIVSGLGYMFAQELAKEVDVPIGIIKNYRGGNLIQPFLSMETLLKRPEYEATIATFNTQKEGITTSWSHIPVAFYNAMTAPLLPFGVKGMLWYQGESNAMNDPSTYDMMLTDYIAQVRNDFDNPEMPFIIVQLTPYKDADYRSVRQIQLDVSKRDENVYLATSAYEGPCGHETQGTIHPAYKNPIAYRAAKAALVNVYKDECDVTGEYQGPEYMDMTVDGNNAILTFSHIGDGLKSAVDGEALKGFEISSDGETFYTATAEIDGDKIKVYAEGVENPVEVRYAYVTCADDNTLGGNLTNSTLIPASPFRASLYAPNIGTLSTWASSNQMAYSYYVENNGYSTGDVNAVTASFDEEGNLVDVHIADVAHQTVGKVWVSGKLDTDNKENITVKNFVFYSMDSLKNID